MELAAKRADHLRRRVAEAEKELRGLREQLARAEAEEGDSVNGAAPWRWPLRADEYDRYGRQLILPQIGIQGQKRLKASRVLIVGAGGLGCPAAAYLAGAGVGTLGFVDGDVVEPSNLHRQIAHGTSRVGMLKVDSLVRYCTELNPLPTYVPHREHLTPTNAEDIVKGYDLVLDCTDHPTSRYLISDICVLLQKPLVSASALRTDGQLIVLNCPPTPQGLVDGDPKAPPCYRCVFPRPPPPEAVVSCGEGGILGPVVGVMGVLQALEAAKIVAAGLHRAGSVGGAEEEEGMMAAAAAAGATSAASPTLLLFSGATAGAPSFRSVRMRTRRKDCFACGEGACARLTPETLRSGSLDYVAFCGGMGAPVKVLDDSQRISAAEYSGLLGGPERGAHVLLDVREKELFDIARIEGAVNVPYSRIQSSAGSRRKADDARAGGTDHDTLPDWIPTALTARDKPVYVVCRVGNDSQLVAKQLIDLGLGQSGKRWIGDLRGGMRAWRDEVDNTLPFM